MSTNLPSLTQEGLDRVKKIEELTSREEQLKVTTNHLLHAGMYFRTIYLTKGELIVGALIKIPTVVIINGNVNIYLGDKVLNAEGYCVLPASAGRKQVIAALEDTEFTMCFPTKAKTIEEAEEEFTDEYSRLLSREDTSINNIIITGE